MYLMLLVVVTLKNILHTQNLVSRATPTFFRESGTQDYSKSGHVTYVSSPFNKNRMMTWALLGGCAGHLQPSQNIQCYHNITVTATYSDNKNLATHTNFDTHARHAQFSSNK